MSRSSSTLHRAFEYLDQGRLEDDPEDPLSDIDDGDEDEAFDDLDTSLLRASADDDDDEEEDEEEDLDEEDEEDEEDLEDDLEDEDEEDDDEDEEEDEDD